MNYFIWISVTLIYNVIVCYISIKFNKFWSLYVGMTLAGFIPTWALTAYYSKNIIFDSLIYDMSLVVSSIIFFAILGKAEKFTFINWIGVFLAIIGLLLIRIHNHQQ